MQRWLFGSRQSERETVLERRCHALHGCLRKAVHHHGALLDYIFHSALKEYRAYEKVRRNPDIGPGAQTLLACIGSEQSRYSGTCTNSAISRKFYRSLKKRGFREEF